METGASTLRDGTTTYGTKPYNHGISIFISIFVAQHIGQYLCNMIAIAIVSKLPKLEHSVFEAFFRNPCSSEQTLLVRITPHDMVTS